MDHALKDAHAALNDLRRGWKDNRSALAEALAGEEVDDAALAAAFARQEQELGQARQELTSALKQVHAVLDADQRSRLVKLLGEARWR